MLYFLDDYARFVKGLLKLLLNKSMKWGCATPWRVIQSRTDAIWHIHKKYKYIYKNGSRWLPKYWIFYFVYTSIDKVANGFVYGLRSINRSKSL